MKNQSNHINQKNNSADILPKGWEVKRFVDIADIDKESLGSNTPKDYEFDYVSLSDVDSEDFKIETTKQIFETAPSRARRIVKKGDILMSTVRPNLQGFSIIKDDVKDLIASTGFAVITTKKCNNDFLFHYLFSSAISKQFYQLLVGSNYPAINSSDVKNLKIILPPLKEQIAIAALLSTWDTAIQKTTTLIAKKELQKKGLMQRLLCGKGKGWEEVELGEVVRYENGKAHEQDIDENGNFIVVNSKFISTEGEVAKKTNDANCLAKKNDILMVLSDVPNGKAIAKCFYVDTDNLYTVNQRICKLTTTKANSKFLFYIINRNSYFLAFDDGVKQTNLKKEEVLECPIRLPKIEDQTRIAQILQTADQEINLLKSKAEKLRAQKKGLMQVLLTGKKRIELK